jgi:hypothetical protein
MNLSALKNAGIATLTWVATGLALAGLLFWGIPSFALTTPPTQSPRQFSTQQTHYLRFSVQATPGFINGYPCVIVSNFCTIKIAALPYNSIVVRILTNIGVAFNSGTNDQISIGTTATSASNVQLLALVAVTSTANLTVQSVAAASTAALGQGTVQSGTDGGFDVYVTYKQQGTAPTTGQATFIMEFIAPNDGFCEPVPMGVQPGTTSGTTTYGQQYC